MPTNASAAAPSLFFLDWVRTFAFGLLVLFHVGMYYVSWDWHIKSPNASTVLEPLMRLSLPWRMTLLFLVSGAATSFMLARRGADGGLLGQRAKRLLLPLLFGVLVIVPPQSYFEVVQHFGYAGDYGEFLRLYLSGYGGFCGNSGQCLILPTWNHLWFLPYLFVYTLLLWSALRAWPRGLDALAVRLPDALSGARLVLLPVAFLAISRIALHDRFPATHALVGDWFAHTQYFAVFLLGATLARAPLLWQRMSQARWVALVFALTAWVLLVIPAPSMPAAESLLALMRPVAHSVVQSCAILAVVGFAHRHLNGDSALRRYLTEAVFPVYILHQTLIMLLAQVLLHIRLAPGIEGPLIAAGTFALSFLGFEIVRRIGWLRPLFGLPTSSASRTPAALCRTRLAQWG